MTDKALVARPTMTPEEEAAWAVRVKLPGAGVQSAAAEGVSTDATPRIRSEPQAAQYGLSKANSRTGSSAAAPRARVPIRRVRLRVEREVAP